MTTQEDKICPVMSRPPHNGAEEYHVNCLCEKCAWWIEKKDNGRVYCAGCAIAMRGGI